LRFNAIKIAQRNERLWWNDDVNLFFFVENGLEPFKTHLFDKNWLSRSDTATAGETVIQGDGGFSLFFFGFHDFGLDAVLRGRDVIINLGKFNNSGEHVDFILSCNRLSEWF
jgi:hypothetical protein